MYNRSVEFPLQTIKALGTPILLENGYYADPDHLGWFLPDRYETLMNHIPRGPGMIELARIAGILIPLEVMDRPGLVPGAGVNQSHDVHVQLDGHPWHCIICYGDERECESEDSISPNVIYCVPCGHKFHVDCLRLWMLRRDTCPICRAVVTGFTDVSIK